MPFSSQMAGVQVLHRRQDYIELHYQTDLQPNLIVEEALRHGGLISRFEVTDPSLTDIFIEKVGTGAQPDVPMSHQA